MKNARDYLLSKEIHPSHQRVAIMDYLLKNQTHPTVEEIHMALNPTMPTLSKTTIYNTLRLFEAKGAVITLAIDERQARYDGCTGSHAHLQCVKCGRIFDIDIERPPILSEESNKFTIYQTAINLKGVCPECKTAEE